MASHGSGEFSRKRPAGDQPEGSSHGRGGDSSKKSLTEADFSRKKQSMIYTNLMRSMKIE
jgi:hypothetical protein